MDRYEVETMIQGLLDGHNLTDLFPPVGSEPYVRRLRDRAAVDAYMRNRGEVAKIECIEAVNEIIRALGYQPPGEPGKEG